MSTLDRLLNALTRVYDKTPGPFLALRLSYLSGQMTWKIADDTLTTSVIGGMGQPLSIDLSKYTLSTLAVYLASQPGYVVPYLDDITVGDVSALALAPGSGDISMSNGDHINAASNLNWLLLSSIGSELSAAEKAIDALPAEMATTTADGEWLDLLGSYYDVARLLNEQDTNYSPRIPAEVILPRQNNFAISAALTASTGQPSTCTDANFFGNPFPLYDGQIHFTGAPFFFNANAQTIYNLFDIAIGYDLLGSLSPTDFLTSVRQQVERLRAAGTHLRQLTLAVSVMGDTFTPPTDSLQESVFIAGMVGIGSSSNSAAGEALYPDPLLISFSANAAIGALTTAIPLQGTASSVDSIAIGIGVATASSTDSAIAVLNGGAPATLAGTSSSFDGSFGDVGPQVIFHGTSSSADSAPGPNRQTGFNRGFSSGFLPTIRGTGAILRTGSGFASDQTTGGSNSATGTLATSIPMVGTSASADTGSLNGSPVGHAMSASSDSAAGSLRTGVKPSGSSASSDSATGTLNTGNLKANSLVLGSVGSFTDVNGDSWSIISGEACKNGVPAGYSFDAVMLRLIDGAVWLLSEVPGYPMTWCEWNGSTWFGHVQGGGWPASINSAVGTLH